MIEEGYRKHGPQWRLIAASLPAGRSGSSTRNRWNRLQREHAKAAGVADLHVSQERELSRDVLPADGGAADDATLDANIASLVVQPDEPDPPSGAPPPLLPETADAAPPAVGHKRKEQSAGAKREAERRKKRLGDAITV